MTLAELIAGSYGGSQRAFAQAQGIDEGQLSKYLAAERGGANAQVPSAGTIAKIQRASGGEITAEHWEKFERQRPPKARRTRRASSRGRSRRHHRHSAA